MFRFFKTKTWKKSVYNSIITIICLTHCRHFNRLHLYNINISPVRLDLLIRYVSHEQVIIKYTATAMLYCIGNALHCRHP